MMLVYRSGGLIQPIAPEKPVEKKTSPWEIFISDCKTLEAMWSDPNITLEDIRRRTHWRSLGQISKVARLKLGLPDRYTVRREKRAA